MISAKVEVEVFMEPDASQPSGYRFLHLKIGDTPPVPLPPDKPAPRRLVAELVAAAAKREPRG